MAPATAITQQKIQPIEADQEVLADLLVLEEQIRQRAYEIWLGREDRSGSDVTDWLQAEEEVLQAQGKR
jgi:hypothetical protein